MLTNDPNDPNLRKIRSDGMQESYLVLSDAERAKGFVRPVRTKYIHLKCWTETRMGLALSETYAREPKFYSGTYCCYCGTHFRLTDADGLPAFLWQPDGDPVGFDADEAKEFFANKAAREAEKHKGAGI